MIVKKSVVHGNGIIAEDGTKLEKPEDGFIVQGNIYVAQVDKNGIPRGGLIGNAFPTVPSIYDDSETDENHKFAKHEIRLFAYSKADFLRALGYTKEELIKIINEMKEEK